MNRKALNVMMVSVLAAGLMAGRAYAADDRTIANTSSPDHRGDQETAALKAQVQLLNERIAQLEKQSVPVQTMGSQWDPWAEMDMMQTAAMNRMATAGVMTPMLNFYSPRTDIQETAQQYTITMDIPGMSRDQINVKTEGRNIIVSGERSSERERNEPGQTYAHERSFGKFIRSVPLPEDAATDSIDAQYNNGVLTMKVARTGKGKGAPQKVTVK